jgi:tape measure domain-containing protein
LAEVAKAFVTIQGNTAPLEKDVAAAAKRAAVAAERVLGGMKIKIGADGKREFSALAAAGKSAADETGNSFASMGRKVGAALAAVGLARGVFAGVSAAANFEQVQVAFTGLLGSAQAGEEAIRKLRDFAAATPFELPGVLKAAQQFIGLGKTVDETLSILGTIGDATAAIGASEEAIGQVTRAIGQMQAKGKLSAEELNQIAEVLPNLSRTAIYDKIGEGLKKTREEVAKLSETGGIAADTGIAAILEAMKEIPGAAGAMERQSKTLIGVVSTLKDGLRDAAIAGFAPLAESIRDTLLPSLEALPALLTATLTPLGKGLDDLFKGMVAGAGSLTSLLPQIADAFSSLASALGGLIPPGAQVVGAILTPLVLGLRALAGALEFILTKVPGVLGTLQALAIVFVAIKVQALTTMLLAFGQALVTMVGTAAAATGAIGGVRAALIGLQASMGPVGLALAGLAGIITIFKGSAAGAEKGTNDFLEAVKALGPAAEEGVNKVIATKLAADGLGDTLDFLGINVKDVGDGIKAMATGTQAGAAQFYAMQSRVLGAAHAAGLGQDKINVLAAALVNMAGDLGDANRLAAEEARTLTALGGAAATAAVDYKLLTDQVKEAASAHKAHAAAVRAQENASEALTKAREKLAKLLAKGAVDAKAVTNAEQALARASDGVTAATERAAASRKALEELLKPATTRELGDAADTVAEAEIALERATLRQGEATTTLNKLTERAGRTTRMSAKRKEELTLAGLDARQADLDQKNAVEALDDARKGLDDTQKKGLTETDIIIAARKEVETAEKAITTALGEQLEAATALTEAKAGDPDYHTNLAAARDDVADAERSVAEATADTLAASKELKTAVDNLSGPAQTAADKFKALVRQQLDMTDLQPRLRAELQATYDKLLTAPELKARFDLKTTDDIIKFLLSHPEHADKTFDLLGIAQGGIFNQATPVVIGEAGREVAIPLTRPARAVSLAQESGLIDLLQRQGALGGGGKTVNLVQHVTAPQGVDARDVANISSARILSAVR